MVIVMPLLPVLGSIKPKAVHLQCAHVLLCSVLPPQPHTMEGSCFFVNSRRGPALASWCFPFWPGVITTASSLQQHLLHCLLHLPYLWWSDVLGMLLEMGWCKYTTGASVVKGLQLSGQGVLGGPSLRAIEKGSQYCSSVYNHFVFSDGNQFLNTASFNIP